MKKFICMFFCVFLLGGCGFSENYAENKQALKKKKLSIPPYFLGQWTGEIPHWLGPMTTTLVLKNNGTSTSKFYWKDQGFGCESELKLVVASLNVVRFEEQFTLGGCASKSIKLTKIGGGQVSIEFYQEDNPGIGWLPGTLTQEGHPDAG